MDDKAYIFSQVQSVIFNKSSVTVKPFFTLINLKCPRKSQIENLKWRTYTNVVFFISLVIGEA